MITDIQQPDTVHCNCGCPMWGVIDDNNIVVVQADICHHKFLACGLCVKEGRIADCVICSEISKSN